MGKKLIITEKPSVARDFARVLQVSGNKKGYIENSDYVISWCYGHLVEMVYPESYDIKYKSWKLEDLPFLPKDYKYGVVQSAKDQYAVVHELLHRDDIDTVYWAGDSGKEGQTIEENIRNYGGVREGMQELRVWIDSQTDDEIKRGINEAKPMEDYARLGKSGIMRTIEDYSLGINFSRALSVKYGNLINNAASTTSYSAIAIGRVMTCVLGMVVNREREIRNFNETPFYRITGEFSNISFNGEWKTVEGSKYYNSPKLYKENGLKKIDDANELINYLSSFKEATINNIEKGESKKKAPLLFNLAELQSECSKIFKINPSQTLQIVQDLYERKYTTYPRTDARVLTKAIAKEIKKNLYGLKNIDNYSVFVNDILDNNKYAGLEKTTYTDDSKVTDHYAIIPTGYTNGWDKLDSLHKSVYELIVKRFLSIFYPPAIYLNLKLELIVDTEHFFTSAKVLKNPGYMKITGVPSKKEAEEENSDDQTCSKEDLIKFSESIKKGDLVSLNKLNLKEGKTSPPKRYTSGNLILAMENAGNLIEDEELREQIKKSGIGTSATRGEILEKLIRIKYLNENKKTQIITPESLGEMIYEVVNLSIPSLLNPEMTASWEKGLEGIVNGSVDDIDYRNKLEDFIRKETNKMITSDLSSDILRNINNFAKSGLSVAGIPLGLKCPDCGGELITTTFGYGCSNYRDENIQCKFSVGKIAGVSLRQEDFKKLIEDGKTDIIEGFIGKNKKKFKSTLILLKNENGKSTVNFDFSNVGPDYIPDLTCPICNGRIINRGGMYVCENNIQDDEKSCRFFIGQIARKELSVDQVTQLIKNGYTKTIRGFKSKTGKNFDACLKLEKSEDGNVNISFDFENVEAKVIKDIKCPVCGGDIIKTSFGFGCSNYKKDDKENGCNFNLGTILGVKITEKIVKELLQNEITEKITGFKSKKGNTFDARLGLDKDEHGKVKGCKFVFDNEQ